MAVQRKGVRTLLVDCRKDQVGRERILSAITADGLGRVSHRYSDGAFEFVAVDEKSLGKVRSVATTYLIETVLM